jgi:hypothetical protein
MTPDLAREDMARAEASGPGATRGEPNVYYCNWCRGWHWGHTRRRIKLSDAAVSEDLAARHERMRLDDEDLRRTIAEMRR